MEPKFSFKDGKAGAALSVRVTTRSTKTGITKVLEDGTIKVSLNSAPVDGKANEELIKDLASVMHCPKTNLEIIAGLTSKNKLIVIFGLDSDRANQLIDLELKKI
jgi:uncharacterized protein (TIGR00251 family)